MRKFKVGDVIRSIEPYFGEPVFKIEGNIKCGRHYLCTFLPYFDGANSWQMFYEAEKHYKRVRFVRLMLLRIRIARAIKHFFYKFRYGKEDDIK